MSAVSAADLLAAVRRRIVDLRARCEVLAVERAGLALGVARGEAAAVARSGALRAEIADGTATIEDLEASIGSLKRFVLLEEAVEDRTTDRERRRTAHAVAAAYVAACERLDEAVTALAVAVGVVDRAAALARGVVPQSLRAAAEPVTGSCEDFVLGLLTVLGALGRDHLPGRFVGERRLVRPVADVARRFQVLVEGQLPLPVEEMESVA
jgi:hypothetical protein